MLCRDAMQQEVVTCRASDSVRWCAALMKDWNIGFVPVTGPDGRLKGVVTDRDLAVRILADGKALSTEVGAIMTSDVVTCLLDDDLHVAEEKMTIHRKSRVVVIDELGAAAGVISLSDVALVESRRRAGQILQELVQREAAPKEEVAVLTGFE